MNENSINEIHQYDLRLAFLDNLEEMQPQIFNELKAEIFLLFQKAFPKQDKIFSTEKYSEDYLLSSENFEKHISANYHLAPEPLRMCFEEIRYIDQNAEDHSTEIREFSKKLFDWLQSYHIDTDWLGECILSLLYAWQENPQSFGKGHLWEHLPVSVFTSIGKEFVFKFRAPSFAETYGHYAKALTKALNDQKRQYLDEIKKQPLMPFSRMDKLKAIEWFITWQFDPSLSFVDVANLETSADGVDDKTPENTIKLISEWLEIPLRPFQKGRPSKTKSVSKNSNSIS